MRDLASALLVAWLGVVLGCGAPERILPYEGEDDAPEAFTVATYNLYVGTDFFSVMEVGAISEIPAAAARVWQEVQDANFPERVEQVATAIAEVEPHAIGLQEVALFRTQSPGDSANGGGAPASDVALDFLELLLAALAARGLDYGVAVARDNADFEVPMTAGEGRDDIRLTDRDVILARDDVEIGAVEHRAFATNLEVSLPDKPFISITVPRGWTSAALTFAGSTYRLVNTHLEVEAWGDVQLSQGAELLEAIADETGPTLLVGDLNSDAAGRTTTTYGSVLAAGFEDAWAGISDPGYSCCQAADLRNESSSLVTRIDYILGRGDLEFLEARQLGATPEWRSASGLWPSDHAGVVAQVWAR